jgi:hypothetical protein
MSPAAQVPLQTADPTYTITKPRRAACGDFVTF